MLALALACLLALLPAVGIGWQVLDSVRNYFGESYARNYTQLKRQSILAPVARELALSLRLADSVVTRQWLLDEGNARQLLDVAYQQKADLMIAAGRNMYTAYKARLPFLDINQEREHAFAGYQGIVTLARQICQTINSPV